MTLYDITRKFNVRHASAIVSHFFCQRLQKLPAVAPLSFNFL